MSSTPKQKKSTLTPLAPLQSTSYLFIKNFWVQAALLVAVAVGFYANSIPNKYALDDDIVMRQNTYVQKGFGGIGEILTNDAYKSFYRSLGVDQQLDGGRYRPLSIVSFAVEQQLFGECYGERFEELRDRVLVLQTKGALTDDEQKEFNKIVLERNELDKKILATTLDLAPVRHTFQIVWYALLLVVLLVFLRECVFRNNTEIAFVAVLLFGMHPIHTEVVANVKSRDEIFSLLFIALTFLSFFRYTTTRIRTHLIWGSVWFFLALLSKEYAVVLIALIPFGLYILRPQETRNVGLPVGLMAGVLIIYGVLRLSSVGTGPKVVNKRSLDPLNEPYLFAKNDERLASKINRLDDYLVLLAFPHDLSADYSYKHFPYSKFRFNAANIGVWISLLLYIGLVVLFIWLIRKKHLLAFAIAFYLAFFGMISNIVFDIGATMGERLIFHSSLGFTMVLAWGIFKLVEYVKAGGQYIPIGLTVLIAVPYALITIDRNPKWESDYTLFTHDVITHPNSALCNGNAGSQYMNKALPYVEKNKDSLMYWSGKAMPYLLKAVEIHPKYVVSWLNLGLCYYHRGDNENAAICWGNAQANFRNNPVLLSYIPYFKNPAEKAAAQKDYATASYWYRLAATANPGDPQLWNDYAGSSFMAMKFAEAEVAFNKAATVENNEINNYNQAPRLDMAMIGNGYRAAHRNDSLMKLWVADSLNPDRNLIMAESLISNAPAFYPAARRMLAKTLSARPGDANARALTDTMNVREKRLLKK